MPKFNATRAEEGVGAERVIDYPGRLDAEGNQVQVAVCVLAGGVRERIEEDAVARGLRERVRSYIGIHGLHMPAPEKFAAFVKTHGIVAPAKGSQIVDLEIMRLTCALALGDVSCPACGKDQPEASRVCRHCKHDAKVNGKAPARPRFLTIEDAREENDLTIAYLFEHQDLWQSECSPLDHHLNDAELGTICKEVSVRGRGFILGLPQSMRTNLLHTLACLLASSLADKSPSGGEDEAAESAESPAEGTPQ